MHRSRSTYFILLFNAIAIFYGLCFSCQNARAEIQYVSDYLVVKIRDKIEPPFKTIGRIKTDEAVTVLNKSGKFYLITTDDGRQGWVDNQYLTPKRPKSLLILELRNELAALKENTKYLLTEKVEPHPEIAQLQKENQSLLQQRDKLIEEVNTLKQQITISNLDSQKFSTQSDEIIAGTTESQNVQLFFAGALVFITGIIVSNFSGRKKKRFSF
ncbi:TIGR04211 family SH3 domain-containing protein [Desulfosediminicola flagellatus]|uniref:TIGR04211 family SH3 domain-containing protein n=1 Tax=Desulfosediminicola flagellatus TaxID=2569541 RepID=UPI0010ACA200|nr:TIGR04211 family SH3 domain-containing protein [Desulfosediminicola flagellatus]